MIDLEKAGHLTNIIVILYGVWLCWKPQPDKKFLDEVMDSTLRFYLGHLAESTDIPEQAIAIRSLLLSGGSDDAIIRSIMDYLSTQPELKPESATMISVAISMGYGCEAYGLGGGDWHRKAAYYKDLIQRYPQHTIFRFKYADCACMAAASVDEYFPLLKEGILMDTAKDYYPTAELFEVIHESVYSLELDILILQQYNRPASKEEFDEVIAELKEYYTTPEHIATIDALRWKEPG